jgi:predicted phage-related endonuclease
VVGSDGRLSASFDGLTLLEDVAYEHKSLNETLRAAMRPDMPGSELPIEYQIQMEQQCMVSGAKKVLFMASAWSGDTLLEERHCWYTPDQELAGQIRRGWAQFERDLAAYVPPEPEAVAAGRAPETLPALHIEVTGMVTASNLVAFKDHALAVFAGINRELTTDQDFADAEKTVKWCADVESRLTAAKQHALSQTESIDALFRAIDAVSAEARTVRLELDKLVTKRKVEVKEEIIRRARAAYDAHVEAAKADTGGPWILLSPPDFAGAAKGKRSLASLQDAVDTVLASAKIAADASARAIRANLAVIAQDGEGFGFLFADKLALICKPIDDLRVLVKARITEHKAAEDERRKAEAEQAAAITEANRVADEAANARVQEAAAVATPTPVVATASKPVPASSRRPSDDEIIDAVCLHFRVHESKVIEWMLDMDLNAASARLAA